ncbi:hypothetical protein G7Y89_g10619 [Cudoniella acicularis]|uniref:Heterokaryon incompatibility domain-containing protein n=1 Tax=Cudoniella acicularis TaxID=354080 RepID=A0A8H4RG30_9HELO|nr:hypothetical protein G7Y89_g10619 [Cudoniella acicularis]
MRARKTSGHAKNQVCMFAIPARDHITAAFNDGKQELIDAKVLKAPRHALTLPSLFVRPGYARGIKLPAIEIDSTTTTISYTVLATQGPTYTRMNGNGMRLPKSEVGPHDFNALIFQPSDRFCGHIIQAVVSAKTGSPASKYISTPPIEHDFGSPSTYTQARAWINSCIDSHMECPRRDAKFQMPLRIVDVGASESQTIRLHHSDGECVDYVALSYCWGSRQAIVLTEKTITDWATLGFALSVLPQTVQDAITVTRNLGLRFIWVDSLCIMQDSDQDKRNEIGKMQAIYRNAYVTVVVACAADCHQGFITPQVSEKTVLPFSVPFRLADGQLDSIIIEPYFEYCPSGQEINARAWTLQERLISPRVLVFTNHPNQLYWDCQSLIDSHGGMKPTRRGWRSHAHAIGRLHPAIYNASGHSADSSFADYDLANIRLEWRSIVEDYAFREISNDSDRLHAISSLAYLFAKVLPSDFYAAGLWLDKADGYLDFVQMLQWRPLNNIGKETLYYQHYTAPSWSWASVYARLTWNEPPLKPICSVLGCEMKLVSQELPYGELKVGSSLHISGPLAEADLVAAERDWHCEGYNLIFNGNIGIYEKGEKIDGSLDHQKIFVQTLQDNDLVKLWLFGLTESKGLILEVADNEKEMKFRRVGYFNAPHQDIDNGFATPPSNEELARSREHVVLDEIELGESILQHDQQGQAPYEPYLNWEVSSVLNKATRIVKGKEDGFECGRGDGTNFDAPPFTDILYSPDTPMPNSASSRGAPTIRHHRIDRQSGRIRKPTQATTRPKGVILQVEQGKEAIPKVVFRAAINNLTS